MATVATTSVLTLHEDSSHARADAVAVEEPLEIRLIHGAARMMTSVAVTMRTPGRDRPLAAGFLFSEGIVAGPGDILDMDEQASGEGPAGASNVVVVTLNPAAPVDLSRLERFSYTSSSCGICGKRVIQAVQIQRHYRLPARTPRVSPQVIYGLPERLRAAQVTFASTGGLHASALFSSRGELQAIFEDVGRHNALDKLVGEALLANRLPLSDHVLVVSGRASFELVQKALMAGVPVLAAVGSPSSLAVDLARSGGMTLLGFVRDQRFNCYTGAQRLEGSFAGMAP